MTPIRFDVAVFGAARAIESVCPPIVTEDVKRRATLTAIGLHEPLVNGKASPSAMANIAHAFAAALDHHQAGRAEQAARLYEEALAGDNRLPSFSGEAGDLL